MEKSCVCFSVAEGIDIPPNSWFYAKLVIEPSMSFLEISNDVLVISITLIGSNPATHGDLETSLLDEVSDLGLHLMSLSGVPHVEILHLNICENFRRILNELKHHSIKYSLNSLSDLDPSLLACEVIIVSL